MNGVVIALNGGAFQYMAYGISNDFTGYSVKVDNVPVVNIEDRILLGIIRDDSLLQYLRINPPKFTAMDYNSLVLGFNFLHDMSVFKHAYFMILTLAGEIFIWASGTLYLVDRNCMAIGAGEQIALGCLYGTDHKEMMAEERLETALGAVHAYNPSYVLSTGIVKI